MPEPVAPTAPPPEQKKSLWNSLELAKLVVGILTPVTVATLGIAAVASFAAPATLGTTGPFPVPIAIQCSRFVTIPDTVPQYIADLLKVNPEYIIYEGDKQCLKLQQHLLRTAGVYTDQIDGKYGNNHRRAETMAAQKLGIDTGDRRKLYVRLASDQGLLSGI